jgi:hypothetical protein
MILQTFSTIAFLSMIPNMQSTWGNDFEQVSDIAIQLDSLPSIEDFNPKEEPIAAKSLR